MFRRSRNHRTTQCALALISALILTACSDEQSVTSPREVRPLAPKASHDIYVSGSPLDLLAVEVSGGELKQPLLYNLPLGEEKNSGFLAMPAGKGYGAIVRGYDRDGRLTHTAKLELESVQVGENKRLELALDPVGKGERATISMDLVGEQPTKEEMRIVIRPDRKTVLDGESITLRATVLDAAGREVAVDPNEIHWAILDPLTGRLEPAMSNEMAMGRYVLYAGGTYWATLIAEYRQWRKDWHQMITVDQWSDVAAGGEATCGLKQSGKLYCWGSNSWKMLGTTKDSSCNGFTCSSAPLLVEGGKLFSSVSVGRMHVCAVEQGTGKPFCWGDNLFGLSGQPSSTVTSVATPTAVSGSPPAFKSISAGWGHSCGVTTAGAAMCWGAYSYGRLGSAVTSNQSAPVTVSPPSGGTQPVYASVSAGMLHSCGITTSSQIFCWGQLAGVTYGLPSEVAMQNGATWSTLSQGGTANHVCATNSAILAMCWGDGSSGQLGNNLSGAGLKSSMPGIVKNSSGGAFSPALVSMATGEVHTCGLTASGNAFCWGHNYEGELGNSSQIASNTPVAASAMVFAKIAVGLAHTCALDSNRDIYCWGGNSMGQLGLGDRNRTLSAGSVTVSGVSTPTKIVAPVP
jgi:alpha-tubulin suppressor-like RCC1 family protein